MVKYNVVEFNVTKAIAADPKVVKGGKNLTRGKARELADKLNEKIVSKMCDTDNLDTIVSYQAIPVHT